MSGWVLSESEAERLFADLKIKLGVWLGMLMLAFAGYQFIRFTSYVPQQVRIERIATLCQAESEQGKHTRIRKTKSDCAKLRYQIAYKLDGLGDFTVRQRDYLYFHYKASDGKTYEGTLPTNSIALGDLPGIGNMMTIRVSRINHAHYMY
jgi:hypothetical protein